MGLLNGRHFDSRDCLRAELPLHGKETAEELSHSRIAGSKLRVCCELLETWE